MRLRLSLIGFALALAAQDSHADTITVAQAHAVVDDELKLVAKYYVFPEKRDAIVTAIRAKEQTGAYDLTNPVELADKLASDVIATAHDKHMWVQYDPAQFKALQAPPKDPQGAAFFEDRMRRINYGYEEMKVLPGNIRYVNLTTFSWSDKSSPAAVATAARFLAGGDAAIIDLRQNGGGDPAAVRAIVSYFMPAKKQLLMTYIDTASGTTGTSYVDLKLAEQRMAGMPLYVLTSGATGSAAEEFSYHIKLFKLGTLVGDTTGGAGNNNTVYPIAPGFIASISTGRAIHPVNNGNWEGVGVVPDVAVPADKALDQAQLLALQNLVSKPGADVAAVNWAITGLKAHLEPAPVPDAAALAAYTGTFGIRSVKLVDGQLVYQRQGGGPHQLAFLTTDLFSIDDGIRLQFKRSGGKVTGFDLITDTGQTTAAERTS